MNSQIRVTNWDSFLNVEFSTGNYEFTGVVNYIYMLLPGKHERPQTLHQWPDIASIIMSDNVS